MPHDTIIRTLGRMKFFLAFVLVCTSVLSSFSLNHDSLFAVWNDTNNSDTSRMKSMFGIIWGNYLYSQPDSGFYYSQLLLEHAMITKSKQFQASALNAQSTALWLQADYSNSLVLMEKSIALFSHIDHLSGMASGYIGIANIYSDQSKVSKSLEYNKKAMKIYEETNNKAGVASALNNIAGIYLSQGNVMLAIDQYAESMEIKEELGDKKGLVSAYTNIGMLYNGELDYVKSLAFLKKALLLSEEIDYKRGRGLVLSNLGIVYLEMNENEIALEFFMKALHMAEKTNDKKSLGECYNILGDFYTAVGNYKEAYSMYGLGLEFNKEIEDKGGVAVALNGFGTYWNHMGDHKKAIEFSLEALNLIDDFGDINLMILIYINLMNSNQELGNYSLALKHCEYTNKLQDSIRNENRTKALVQKDFKYKYEKKEALKKLRYEKELALVEEKEKKQDFIATATASGLLMVFVFAYLLFNRLRITSKQKKLIEEQKKDITDSINYAWNIQDSLLPNSEFINELLPNSFVFFKPKDKVSGDFFWVGEKDDYVFFAVCDCTGHGIPGAFMSMIGSVLLNEIVLLDGEKSTKQILNRMRLQIINSLNQKGILGESQDGMDMMLCRYDKKKGELLYTGAYQTLVLIREGELTVYKGDSRPVGYFKGQNIPFTEHSLVMQKGDMIYLFSDGYQDQFGGSNDKKFKIANLKKLFLSIHSKPMPDQKKILEDTLSSWMGETEQIDDVLIMGIGF